MPHTFRTPLPCCPLLLTLAATTLTAAERQPLVGTAVFTTGYDHEVLILPETLALEAPEHGYSAEAETLITWRAVRSSAGRLDAGVAVDYRDIDGGALSELHVGGGLTATTVLGPFAVSTAVDSERRWLDDESIAWQAGGILGVAMPIDDQVARPELEARAWRFDDFHAADGVLAVARYGHWLPISDLDPRRRVELAASAGYYHADEPSETYREGRLDLGIRGRAGRWDGEAQTWSAWRTYDSGARDESWRTGVTGSLDRWLDSSTAIGAIAAWESASDSPTDDDREALRAAVRATAEF